MILWDPAGHFCSGWVDNSLGDDSLIFRVDSGNFAQQEVEFAIKLKIFSKWQRRCGRFEGWWKTGSFISAEYSFSDYFTNWRASQLSQPHRAENSWEPAKRSQQFWRVGSVPCSNHGVQSSAETLARWSCLSEWETAGIFKTSNLLIKRQNRRAKR